MTTLTVDADHITITEVRCRRCKLLTDGTFGDRDNVCHCLSEPHINTRSAVIVMDGEQHPIHNKPNGEQCNYRPVKAGRGQWFCTKCGNGGPTPPPEQVRRLTEPCQTCGGLTWMAEYNGMDPKPRRFRCTKCRGGKPTFTLHQRCGPPVERGGTCDWGGCNLDAPHWRWADDLAEWLPVCDQHVEPERRHAVAPGAIGTPHLILPPQPHVIDLGDGWVITDVLLIVDAVLDGGYRTPDRPVIEIISPTYRRLWYWGERHQQWQHKYVTLPPAARSGQFAVFCEQGES